MCVFCPRRGDNHCRNSYRYGYRAPELVGDVRGARSRPFPRSCAALPRSVGGCADARSRAGAQSVLCSATTSPAGEGLRYRSGPTGSRAHLVQPRQGCATAPPRPGARRYRSALTDGPCDLRYRSDRAGHLAERAPGPFGDWFRHRCRGSAGLRRRYVQAPDAARHERARRGLARTAQAERHGQRYCGGATAAIAEGAQSQGSGGDGPRPKGSVTGRLERHDPAPSRSCERW